MKMQQETFKYPHVAPNGIDTVEFDWLGYIGGDIPDGLIVSRLSRLDARTKPSPLWTVFHHSGYVVNYDLAVRTRKQAIAFAVELGKVAKQADFTWDMAKDDIMRKTVEDGTYHSLKEHLVPDAIRKALGI